MGSAQSRNERRRASALSSIDDRPSTRRRLDPLRRLSTLGRGSGARTATATGAGTGTGTGVTKRDRGQSIESEKQDEREKRQRTGSRGQHSDHELAAEASSSSSRRSETGCVGEVSEEDPLALERTQSIDTIRQVLGNDWTPPWSCQTPTPDANGDTTTPSTALRQISAPAPTPTPALSTTPGPPMRANTSSTSIHVLGIPEPTPPIRQQHSRRPFFPSTPNLTRRWSGSFTPQPAIFQNSEEYLPLTRSQSELPPIRLRNDDRGTALYPRYYRDEIHEHLRVLSNQRQDMRERLNRIRAAVDRADPEGAAQEAESARRALGLPRSAMGEGEGEGGGGEGEGGRRRAGSTGAVLMIQGLAQMQAPSPPEPAPRRRFGRRNNISREHTSEQANMIANLLTVASAATATTLWSTAEPRAQPNRMLETLMRRIRPRRPFSVRRHLGSYINDSIGTANRAVVINADPSSDPPRGNDVAAAQFMTWLETIQADLVGAMTEFSEGTRLSLSRRNSDDPPTTSSSSLNPGPSSRSTTTTRRGSEPSIPPSRAPRPDTPRPPPLSFTPIQRPSPPPANSVPSFHHQEGQNLPPRQGQGQRSVTSTDDSETGTPTRRLNFFRAHVFPPIDPNDTSENPVVPCVFVGVRSVTHESNQTPEDLLEHPSFPFSNGQVPPGTNADAGTDANGEGTTTRMSSSSTDTDDMAPEASEENTESAAAPSTPTTTPAPARGPQTRAQSLRARLLALSPFARHSANTSTTETTYESSSAASTGSPDPASTSSTAPTGPTSTFLVYVVGGNYPRNHPILSIPALVTGGPLTDEEMILVGELMGQVKPPTATAEEVEKSGLRVFDASEIQSLVGSGEVLDGSAERCLVCLSDFDQGEECRLLGCRHVFHKDCVDQWIKVGRNACPACRTEAVDKSKSKSEVKPEVAVNQPSSGMDIGSTA